MRIENGGPYIGHECLVLFPFDAHSLPYQNGVELKLHGHTAPCGTTPRVLEPGSPGDPDSLRAIYYGSVHRVGGQLYMWYLGQDHDQGWFSRVCLATSRDGHTWHKPNLGLVEYKGSSRNNPGGPAPEPCACPVLCRIPLPTIPIRPAASRWSTRPASTTGGLRWPSVRTAFPGNHTRTIPGATGWKWPVACGSTTAIS